MTFQRIFDFSSLQLAIDVPVVQVLPPHRFDLLAAQIDFPEVVLAAAELYRAA
jgi:hypothetical protein